MKPIEYPSHFDGFWWEGWYIHEPGGMVTNVGMACLCAWIIWKFPSPSTKPGWWWKGFYGGIMIGAIGGTFTHGFPTYLGEKGFYQIWLFKNSFVPISNFCLLIGILRAGTQRVGNLPLILFALKALAAWILMASSQSFTPIAVDLGLTYLLAAALSLRWQKPLSFFKQMAWGFIIALGSGIFFVVKFDPHKLWLTHKDLVHLGMYLSLLLIFRGMVSEHRSRIGPG